jgi:hypothetical protein
VKLDPAAPSDAEIASDPLPPPTDRTIDPPVIERLPAAPKGINIRPLLIALGFVGLLAATVGVGYGVANFSSSKDEAAAGISLTASSYAVQLGTLPTNEGAEQLRARLIDQRPELLAGQALRIEVFEPDGTTIFRVLAEGFADFDSAERLCRQLRPHGVECLVMEN